MIKELTIIVPPEHIMNNFKDVVEYQLLKIKKNQIQIRILETLRDTLLPKLMNGEIRIKI